MLNPYDVFMKMQSKDRLASSLRRQLETERARVRVLLSALDAISESEWDASAGLLRDIANEAIAAAPEGGDV